MNFEAQQKTGQKMEINFNSKKFISISLILIISFQISTFIKTYFCLYSQKYGKKNSVLLLLILSSQRFFRFCKKFCFMTCKQEFSLTRTIPLEYVYNYFSHKVKIPEKCRYTNAKLAYYCE